MGERKGGKNRESSFGTNRDGDGASEGMEGASEKNAKMRAVARRRAGSEFDEDRTSRGRVVICTAAEREASKEEQRRERGAEDAPIRTGMETGGGTSARGETERVRHRADADERARRKRGLKKREGTRGKRGGTISRGSERERPRG